MKQPTTKKNRTVSGVLSVNARGFGFVVVPDGADLFIPLDNLSSAMDGDTVVAEIVREVKDKNPVGRIVEVTERATTEIVGIFRRADGRAVVIPEDDELKRPVAIPENRVQPSAGGKPPKEGQLVVVQREPAPKTSKPSRRRGSRTKPEGARDDTAAPNRADAPTGRIVEVLGSPNDKGIDLRIIARSKGLPLSFPKAVDTEARAIKPLNAKTEAKRREDLRKLDCFTIDPKTAKDFDDAVSLTQLANGMFELGVHIADVSHYVKEDSALDREARERATSVYLVQHVIPMLPERLSNDLCSLRPNEDRPAFSVMMTINSRGEVKDYRIVESIIRSKHRFAYEDVEEIIHGGKHRYAPTIHLMMMVSLLLRRQREQTGSIDFDVPEAVILLDRNGVPYEVRPSERLDAHRLVEEFMLVANRTIARHMVAKATQQQSEKSSRRRRGKKPQPWPFVYRVHEKPKEADVHAFLSLLESLGIQYRVTGELEPDDYRKIMDIIENLEFKDFVEKVALRSMTKAVYSTENLGHFGLAFDAYTHFTSPIRRYADLVVHRLLKQYAADGRPKDDEKLRADLQSICDHSTAREIRAVDAEREYTRLKAMEFLAGKVGETYDGVIAGVTSFGVFVEITHYLIEGLVHVSELKDDHYDFDKENYQLVGKKTKRVFRLGDRVRVRIKDVSTQERKANFVLAE